MSFPAVYGANKLHCSCSLDLFICDTGVMAQWLEHLPHNQKAVGLRPVGVIPKTFKMVLTAFSSGT